MDSFVYNAINRYFHTLGLTGYMNKKNVNSLLVLIFYYNLIYHDYRGYVSKKDYHSIEKALNCLYGTNCLIPYPDYLKMGKLKLGEMTEVIDRIKVSEEVLEEYDKRILDNKAQIEDNTVRIDEYGSKIHADDAHFAQIDEHLAQHDEHLATHDSQIENHENRISAVESTKVVKGKNHIQNIPDIDLTAFDDIQD